MSAGVVRAIPRASVWAGNAPTWRRRAPHVARRRTSCRRVYAAMRRETAPPSNRAVQHTTSGAGVHKQQHKYSGGRQGTSRQAQPPWFGSMARDEEPAQEPRTANAAVDRSPNEAGGDAHQSPTVACRHVAADRGAFRSPPTPRCPPTPDAANALAQCA